MKKYLIIIPAGLLLWAMASGCTENDVMPEVPEHIQELENLTVFAADAKSAREITFIKETVYGDSDVILIGELGKITADRSGRVFISDSSSLIIHVFEPDGTYSGQLGRDGRGPGEFSSLKNLQIQNDRLYAFDFRQNRVNIFNLNTLLLEETLSLAKNRGEFRELRGFYPSIDEFYVQSNSAYIAKFISTGHANKVNWKNIDVKGTLYLLDRDGDLSGKYMEFTDEIRTIFPVRNVTFDIPLTPFFGKSLRAFTGDGKLYRDEPDHFLIKVYSPDGIYERAFYYPRNRIPITQDSALHDRVLDELAILPELLIENINSVDLPEFWPVLTDMKIDDQDRLWIAATVDDMSIYEWWVLEETGELISKFEWSRDEPIEVIKNGYMYTRETDEETGLQQVVRYRIEIP